MEDQKLEDKSVKDLQAELVTLGMPEEDTKGFTTKAPLVATINALRASKTVEKVDALNVPSNPKEEKEIETKWRSKAQTMGELLMKEPMVRYRLPLEPKEKPGVVQVTEVKGIRVYKHISGAVETVTLNGYKTIIPKGPSFEIPQRIAEELDKAFFQTQEAGKDISADRIDPETGKPVRDQIT